MEAADWDAALPELEAAVGLAGQVHQPFFAWLAGTVRTMLALLRSTPGGEADVAAVFARRIAELPPR